MLCHSPPPTRPPMSAEGVLEPPDGEERSLASTVMVASDCTHVGGA